MQPVGKASVAVLGLGQTMPETTAFLEEEPMVSGEDVPNQPTDTRRDNFSEFRVIAGSMSFLLGMVPLQQLSYLTQVYTGHILTRYVCRPSVLEYVRGMMGLLSVKI